MQKCEFKEILEENSKLYYPDDIKAYRIENNKYYISKEVTVNEIKKTVFLEYLLNGIVDLYYMKDLDNEYYYIEKDSILHELSNNDIEVHNKYFVKESNQYKGMLMYLFRDSPETSNKIQYTNFNYGSLIKITKDYHTNVCTDYECVDYTKNFKSKIYIEPYAGYIYSLMRLKKYSNFGKDAKPFIGFNCRFTNTKVHYLWNFLIGINYSSNYFLEDFDTDPAYRVNIKYSVIRIPLSAEYYFPARRIQPYVTAGYNSVIIITPDYEVREINTDINALSSYINTKYRRYQIGIFAGTGIKYELNDNSYFHLKSILEYRRSVTDSNYVLDKSIVYSFFISLGYGFKIN